MRTTGCIAVAILAASLLAASSPALAQEEIPVPDATPAAAMPEPAPAPSRTQEALPPYLQGDRSIAIFDPPQSEKLNPLRQAAEQLRRSEQDVFDLSRAKAPGHITYNYEMIGSSETDILAQARVSALESAAARIYFDNLLIVGRELLSNYLKANGQRFIVRSDVRGRRILANDRIVMKLAIGVDLDALYNDMIEKRFIDKPNLRPKVAVLLRETIDGQADPSAEGRRRVEMGMQDNLFEAKSREMREPSLETDLSRSEADLKQARLEAERHDADYLITGTLAIRGVTDGKILFDDYNFREADLTLYMYRVDTGELIQTVEDHYSAAGESAQAATGSLLDAMMTRASRKLAQTLRDKWEFTMLDKADYRLMFSNLDDARKLSVINSLKRLSPDIQLYEKAYFGDVWVVNVVLPENVRGDLEAFLKKSTQPQYRVTPRDAHHFELELI